MTKNSKPKKGSVQEAGGAQQKEAAATDEDKARSDARLRVAWKGDGGMERYVGKQEW